jgi:hypothetical protein
MYEFFFIKQAENARKFLFFSRGGHKIPFKGGTAAVTGYFAVPRVKKEGR